MKTLLQNTLNHTRFENGVEIIRIYLGIGLLLKGFHFMLHPQDLVFWLNQGQFNVMEALISHYVITGHIVGGLLLTFGLLTRVAAAIQIPILIGALGIVHSKETLFSLSQNIELTAMTLMLLIIFSIIGSGNLSLDYHILGEDSKTERCSFIKKLISKLFLSK